MNGWFVFALIFFVVAVLAAAAIPLGGGITAGAVAGVAAVLGIMVTIIASYDGVPTREVGIKTHFGRPLGTCGAGPCWHAPWDNVSTLSEAIQLQSFESNDFNAAAAGQASPNAGGPAINVRLANNSNAFVDINLNWRLREGAAPKLFQDYGGSNVFDTIRNQLVDRQAQVMVSKVFATFNPQTLLTPIDPTPPPPAPGAPAPVSQPTGPTTIPTPRQGADLPGMADQVKKDLQDAVGTEIEILDVRIPRLWYDGQTQGRIDAYNQNVQDTLNASQQVKTAEQQRLAAEQRAMQPPPDLRIAMSNCINQAAADHRDAAGCFGQIGGQPLIQIPAQH